MSGRVPRARSRARATVRAAALVALFAACAATPRHRLEQGDDVVRADDPELAAAVAERLALGRERLEGRLPDLSDTGVEVWVQERVRLAEPVPLAIGGKALTVHRPGRPPRIHVSARLYRDTLQHELVHALLGPSWSTLPTAAEEGLCTLLNDELAEDDAWRLVYLRCAARAGGSSTCTLAIDARSPDGKERRFATFWGHAGGSDATASRLTPEEILRVSSTPELAERTPAEIDHLYGVGYMVVRRIAEAHGLERLHALCLRAAGEGRERIPPAWLLEAADVPDAARLEALALDALREEQLLVALDDESFSGLVRSALRFAVPEQDAGPDAFHARCDGELAILGTPVDLSAHPAFRAWLVERWDALRAPADERDVGGA